MTKQYDDIIPVNFKDPKDALKFYTVSRPRKCFKCKGKKTKQDSNIFYCNNCK